MVTFFDVISVASFVGLVLAFFWWTERDTRTLLHFVISGTVLAVANQVGNCGKNKLGKKIRASVNYVSRDGKWLEAFYMETAISE